MSKSNTFEDALLAHIFNAGAMPTLGANLFVALHTADPGEAGTQATNEVTYGGYARVALPRTTAGATVLNGTATIAQHLLFPTMTSGTQSNATHVTIGVSETGAGLVLYRGSLTNSIPLVQGAAPLLPSGSTISED